MFKAWISEECLAANSNAMQVLGGAGYTRDHPVEQHYRDNRLNPIHEGTNGIQAIDLLGRKLVMAEGRALGQLMLVVHTTWVRARSTPIAAVADVAERGMKALEQVNAHLQRVRGEAGAAAQLAHAADVMEIAGCTVFAWIWAEQALAALEGLARGVGADESFLQRQVRRRRDNADTGSSPAGRPPSGGFWMVAVRTSTSPTRNWVEGW